MSTVHEKELQADLKSGVAKLLQENPGMDPTEALRVVSRGLLKNNPFCPPTGVDCPINDLPNELLAHIFYVGMTMEEDEEEEEDEDEFEDEDIYEDGLLEWDSDEEDEEDDGASRNKSPSKQKDSGEGSPKNDDEADEEDDEDDETQLPFQVLVSHVCRHWRAVATESPLLWTTLKFQLGTSLDRAKVWLDRSKGHPLHIELDCSGPDDLEDEADIMMQTEIVEASGSSPKLHVPVSDGLSGETQPPYLTKDQVSEILDVILPAVDRWKLFSVTSSHYDTIYLLLERFSQCSSAPLLEMLEMYHYEDCEDFQVFSPAHLNTKFLPFHGVVPKLKSIALWGVHIDWDASRSFMKDLRDIELAYHADDVRPSFQTFSDLLTGSPELETLSLSLSGPAGQKEDWDAAPIELPSVKSLTLCHHEPAYIESLLPLLYLPNVVELVLDYDSGDYTELAIMLAKPFPGRTKSLLSGLEFIKIDTLPSNRNARQLILEQLVNLKSITLNCVGDEEEFFERLMELKPTPSEAGTSHSVVFCPLLNTLTTTGIEGNKMKKFVEVRKQGGAPLSRVSMSEEDDLDEKEEQWLRDHLEELEFHEPSDSEEELDLDEIEEEEDMDVD